ncbi:MAG: hypothetical protein ABJM90_00890 [Paracoccaceae bacterium]
MADGQSRLQAIGPKAVVHQLRSIGQKGLFADLRCGRQHRLIPFRKPMSAMRTLLPFNSNI